MDIQINRDRDRETYIKENNKQRYIDRESKRDRQTYINIRQREKQKCIQIKEQS